MMPTAIGRLMNANRILLRGLQELEDDLEDDSVTGQAVRPRLQYVFARWLGVGNEQVYVGRQHRLYYRRDLDIVTGAGFLEPARLAARTRAGEAFDDIPRPDPRPAIIDFHQSLAARGIQLVLLPVPGKATVDPRGFTPRSLPQGAMPRNIDFQRFIAEMQQNGIFVFDPVEVFETGRSMLSAHDVYLLRDTHWRPDTMQAVAEALAVFLREKVDMPDVDVAPHSRCRRIDVTGAGDLVQMLKLPAGRSGFAPETVTINQVLTEDGHYWRPDTKADILLLGDSFSNIYAFEPLGWGESAGLAEHLSLALGRPLDRIVRNDAGAYATRAMLAAELARGHDRLSGKKVVIWQFAERELFQGNWPVIPMELGDPEPSRFVTPRPGEALEVRGTVQDAAPAPRPGTVPYRDHVVALHLVDIEHPSADIAGGQALVYMWSMRDNEWTRAARLRRGEVIAVRLQDWQAVSGRLEAVKRAELDDWELQLEDPCWGELLEE